MQGQYQQRLELDFTIPLEQHTLRYRLLELAIRLGIICSPLCLYQAIGDFTVEFAAVTKQLMDGSQNSSFALYLNELATTAKPVVTIVFHRQCSMMNLLSY